MLLTDYPRVDVALERDILASAGLRFLLGEAQAGSADQSQNSFAPPIP